MGVSLSLHHNNQVLTAGSKSYRYDDNGNMTTVTVGMNVTTLTWDYNDKLTQILCPDTSTNTFVTNDRGVRVQKVDSGGTTNYLRDGSSVLADSRADYANGGVGGLISERASGTSRWYHADHLGSTRGMTTSNESVADTRETDAFGMTVATCGSTATPFGFVGGQGYQSDVDRGLMLLGARYYEGSLGRFITRDPIRYKAGDVNLYRYCANNPVSNSDPTGLMYPEPIGGDGPLPFVIQDRPRGWEDDLVDIVWQLPQETLGALGSIGGTPIIWDEESRTVVVTNTWFTDVTGYYITLGHYVLTGPAPEQNILAHEYVHRQQSEVLGPIYLPAHVAGVIGAGRVIIHGGDVHDNSPLEMDADARSGVIDNVESNRLIGEHWIR